MSPGKCDNDCPECLRARIADLEAALHAAIMDLDMCAYQTDMFTGELMTWKDSRRIANRAAVAARKALEKANDTDVNR